jgi:hypothetical protein
MRTYFQQLALDPTALRSLATDHSRILSNGGPSDKDMELAPVIRDWTLVRSRSRCLTGRLDNGTRLNGGNALVWSLDLDAGWARTTSSFYRLESSKNKSIEDLRSEFLYQVGTYNFLEF